MGKLIDVDSLKFPNIAIFNMKLHGTVVPMVRLLDLQMLMPTVDATSVARVMTLGEVGSCQPDPDTDDNIVWIEWRGGCVRVAHIIGIDHLVCAEYPSGLDTLIYEHLSEQGEYEIHGKKLGQIRQMMIGHLNINNYGKTWRCWTAKPTDEQRKAVKWDDPAR